MIRDRLERDDFSSNRHPALSFCLSMISFGKPAPTFPDHALGGGARFFNWFNERLRRKRLGQVGKATHLGYGSADRFTVVAGDKDDWQAYALVGKAPAHFDAGLAIQVDIHDHAKRPIEITMPKDGIGRIEQF